MKLKWLKRKKYRCSHTRSRNKRGAMIQFGSWIVSLELGTLKTEMTYTASCSLMHHTGTAADRPLMLLWTQCWFLSIKQSQVINPLTRNIGFLVLKKLFFPKGIKHISNIPKTFKWVLVTIRKPVGQQVLLRIFNLITDRNSSVKLIQQWLNKNKERTPSEGKASSFTSVSVYD